MHVGDRPKDRRAATQGPLLEERHVVGLRGDDVQVLLTAMRVGVDEGIAAGGKEN